MAQAFRTLIDPFATRLFVLLLLVRTASALDPDKQISQYAHTAWRIQDGWFTQVPNAITRTTDGYVWVATDSGLLRFNGLRFEAWTPPSGQSLPRSDALSLLGARDGSLWIGTGRGLARLKEGRLITYAGMDRWVNSIVEDRAGAIWIVRSHGAERKSPLCRVSGETVHCYGTADGIQLPTARRLTVDHDGNFWIGGFSGLCRWKPGFSKEYFQKELGGSGKLIGVEAIAADGDGTVWTGIEGSGHGRELQRLQGGIWKSYALPGLGIRETEISALEISALLIDRDHALWIGTRTSGIYRVHNGKLDRFRTADGLSTPDLREWNGTPKGESKSAYLGMRTIHERFYSGLISNGAYPMRCELKTPDLNKIFMVALLLTRRMQTAEMAVLRSIQSSHPDDITEKTLVIGAIKAVAQFGIPFTDRTAVEWPASCPELPMELQKVMDLAPALRYCFVARVLAGLPLKVCASLLRLAPHEVAAYSRAAVQTLSSTQQKTMHETLPLRELAFARALDFGQF